MTEPEQEPADTRPPPHERGRVGRTIVWLDPTDPEESRRRLMELREADPDRDHDGEPPSQ